MMIKEHRRYRNRSLSAIVAAVMITAVLVVQERVHGQIADVYVCETACTSPQWQLSSSTDLWAVLDGAVDGDVIWVAQGTYHPVDSNDPGDIENSFELKAGVQVYGNFDGTEATIKERDLLITANASILDGLIATNTKVLHVVRADDGGSQLRRIDGFTIRNGHARGYVGDCQFMTPPVNSSYGGGMFVESDDGVHLAIIMCRFEDNQAGASTCPPGLDQGNGDIGFCHVADFRGLGGALALMGSSITPGPVREVYVHNCAFINNRAQTGQFNDASGPMGGALFKSPGFGELEIMNSVFAGNAVDARNMPCDPDPHADPAPFYLFNDVDIWVGGGGAISFGGTLDCPPIPPSPTSSRVWNCTIYGNELRGTNDRRGRGIWASRENSYDPENPNALSLYVFNSIVYGNVAYTGDATTPDTATGDQIGFPSDGSCIHTPYVAFSNVRGGWAPPLYGTDNINLNPKFVDAGAGDFRLTSSSPCIDAGTKSGLPLDIFDIAKTDLTDLAVPDQDLRLRIIGCQVDMGAFEFPTPASSPGPADLTGDCCVDLSDLLLLLSSWGPCPASACPADLDNSGAVDLSDLLLLLAAWGDGEGESCDGVMPIETINDCFDRIGLSNIPALTACLEAMISQE